MGNAEAMFYLGNFYCDGIQIRRYAKEGPLPRKLLEDRCLVKADNSKALEWYRKSANGGNGDAMRTIACAYEEGKLDLRKDGNKANEWFNRLIGSGDTKAMANLGWHYIGEKKYNYAVEWFERSANYGDENGIQALAMIYRTDKYDLQDYSKALKYWQKLVDMKKGPWVLGLNLIGMIYEDGDDTVKRDYDKALEYYKRAVAEGDKDAIAHVQNVEEKIRRKNDDSGCFITTAVCKTLGKPDDCYELTTFRKFRDTWLIAQPDGKNLIAEYYIVAPKIVASIDRLAESSQIYKSIWQNHLSHCLKFIETADNQSCKENYIKMVNLLKGKFVKEL